MTKSKQYLLIKRLFDLTNKGEIDWDQIGDNETFVATLGQYGVVIAKDSGWTGASGTGTVVLGPAQVMLRLMNPEGDPIDEIRATEFTDPTEQHEVGIWLEELFNGARRKAKGADQIIDGILTELDKRGQVH